MRNLNQIIIEGTITNEISRSTIAMATFTINCNKNEFKCLVPGEELTNRIKCYGRKDRGIRIVGYLTIHNNETVICIEHIEFKPMFNE